MGWVAEAGVGAALGTHLQVQALTAVRAPFDRQPDLDRAAQDLDLAKEFVVAGFSRRYICLAGANASGQAAKAKLIAIKVIARRH